MMTVPSARERGEEMPALVQRDENQSGIENGDVAEEAERIVLTGGKQDRREKAAQACREWQRPAH